MVTKLKTRADTANKLLKALSAAEFKQLAPALESVNLAFGEVLVEPGQKISHVYFPNNSLVSLLTVVDDHLALEVGMTGYEGMVGVSYALGANLSLVRALVQGAGSALRMEAGAFRRHLRKSQPLQQGCHLYANALMAQIAQTAACNRFHVIEARLARWLLMTRDRVDSNSFHLTHEFLGDMLGVRRVGVTKAAHELRLHKLIEYSRGDIKILNSRGLEAAACSCYRTVNAIQ